MYFLAGYAAVTELLERGQHWW